MGNTQSIEPTHIRIYNNILAIQNPTKRQEILETVLVGNEYINSAKQAGVYSHLLAHLNAIRTGKKPIPLPGEYTNGGSGPPINNHINNHINNPINKTPINRNEIINSLPPIPKYTHTQEVAKEKYSKKSLSFFTSCLRVLKLEEEVALTESSLKKAYRQASITAHPDKGGSEEEFESITRAYAYLSEILKLIKGERTKEGQQGIIMAVEQVKEKRKEASVVFQHAQPVLLNPENIDINKFNKLFEETRLADPDDDGYGDWFKSSDNNTTSDGKIKGKFNHSSFNKAFEEDSLKNRRPNRNDSLILNIPSELVSNNSGVTLGRDKPDNFTAPANANLHYTDLKQAYEWGSTFSGEVANVQVGNRNIKTYTKERDSKMNAYNQEELAELNRFTNRQVDEENSRQLRAAEHDSTVNDYFERMKRLVIHK